MNREIPVQNLLDRLEGVTIVGWSVEEETGLHLQLEDGRALVIAGMYYLSLIDWSEGTFH